MRGNLPHRRVHLEIADADRLILTAAVAGLFFASCMRTTKPATAAARLECRLEASGPAAVRFTLVNRTDSPLWALRWNTPLEGWKGTIFALTSGGAEDSYTGPMLQEGRSRAARTTSRFPREGRPRRPSTSRSSTTSVNREPTASGSKAASRT